MNIEIANRLTAMRKERGYSQEELAEKLGLSRQAISKWERGEASPDTDNLLALASLYGIGLDELLQGGETAGRASSPGLNPKRRLAARWKEKQSLFDTIFFLVCLAAFLVMGFVWDLWYVCWNVFLLYVVVSSLLRAIVKKDASQFAYPVLVTMIYCSLGLGWRLWDPYWAMLLTIPFYYGIVKIARLLRHKPDNSPKD